MRRPLPLALAALVAGLALLSGCKKRPADPADPPAPGAPSDPPAPPPALDSDHLLFLHLNAKALRDSAPFKELKAAVTSSGGPAMWDEIDTAPVRDLGLKLTELDSVSTFVTEFQPKGEPHVLVVLTANRPFARANNPLLGLDIKYPKGVTPPKQPDERGFYRAGGAFDLAHFPDDKTLVLLSAPLADKYLAGFAKARTGWPFAPTLSRAAGENALVLVANLAKLPPEVRDARDLQEFRDVIPARGVTLTANLRGKELTATARAGYASPAAATAAKDKLQELLGAAATAVTGLSRELGEFAGPFRPLVTEAERAVGGAKLALNGSDVTLAATYKVDFDIAALVADAVKRVKETAPRLRAQNNLKQVLLGLHNYESAHLVLPVHAIGPQGRPVKGPNEKALLSWRVAVLPYIEQDALYRQFKLDEPWDSDHNKKLIDKMPAVFAPATKPPVRPGHTHVQMTIGPGGTRLGSTIVGITDGTSNTLALVEAADPVIWTKPDDVTVPLKFAPGALRKRFGTGEFPGGFHVVFWDGTVRFLRDSVPEATLGLLCHPSDGRVIPAGTFDDRPPAPGKPK